MQHKNQSKGFSIIEVLTALAIVSILGTIGLTAYRDHSIKARIQEAYTLLGEYQNYAIYQYTKSGQFLPYNILFPVGEEGQLVTGSSATPAAAASRSIQGKYVTLINASTGTSGGEDYILLGARLNTTGTAVTSTTNMVYMRGIKQTVSANQVGIVWQCMSSGLYSVASKYLASTCI